MFPFSTRTRLEREPNELARALREIERRGERPLDLTESNPTRAGVPYAEREILAALAHPRALVYAPEALGPRAARQAVAGEWARRGVSVSPERVVLTASTSEAYGYLFKLLCDPGDEVLVPAPSYPLFDHLTRYESVSAVPYALGYDGAWFVDLERVAAAVTPRTRAILCVSPNNPTGNLLKQAELAGLARLGLPLISDEVFGSYVFDAAGAPRSALEAGDALVFALSGLSKLAALPQLKLAWITLGGPEAAVAEALARLELVADAYLSPSAPVLGALPELLRLRAPSEQYIQGRLAKNYAALGRALAATPATPLPVEGGWYAVIALPATQSEESWLTGLLREAGVLAQPGYFYDFPSEPYAVVSLLTPEPEFALGLARLAAYVASA